MFPCSDPASTLMHRGLERAADRFGDRDAVRAGDERWSFARPRRPRQRVRPPPGRPRRRPRRPGGGDDVQPGRVRRRRPRHQQARRGRRPAEPGVEGGRGRPRPRADRARATPSPTAPAAALLADRLGAGRRHRPRRRGRRSARRSPTGRPPAPPAPARRRPTPTTSILVFSSGTTGLPKAVRHTHRSIGHATAPLVRRPRPRPRRPLPGGHAPVAHPRPAQPAGRGGGRRHRPPPPPLRPRRGAAPHRVRPHHPRDGRRPHRPGDGQPPRPRAATTSRRSATSCGAPRR